ncbi:MAG: hypothetical protein H8E00_00155 [Deltaproteobacteria bacterium]|nr:hypothetical protein [Deltaproteobacteria bacterium]
MTKIVKAEIVGMWEDHLPSDDNPDVAVEYDNGEKGVLFSFDPWHYHAYTDGLPEKGCQPFPVKELVGLTPAEARVRFKPDPPRSYHEQSLREAVDEWKQLKANKNKVVDIRSRMKPVE